MYIAPPSTQWYHCTAWDDGGDLDGFVPAEWLPQARSQLVGAGLIDLVTGVSGFTETTIVGGERVYTGIMTAAELATHELGIDAPFAPGTLRAQLLARDVTVPTTDSRSDSRFEEDDVPVSIEVRVGADGLIREATLSYPGTARAGQEDTTYTYSIGYRQLGAAPSIEPPDAAQTITTDKPNGYSPK